MSTCTWGLRFREEPNLWTKVTEPQRARSVDRLDAAGAGLQLVNLSCSETRNLIVQAGAFAEHHFVEVSHGDQSILVDEKHLAVQLPPGSSIRLEMGIRRFAHKPTYAFPWHGDSIPVPYQ